MSELSQLLFEAYVLDVSGPNIPTNAKHLAARMLEERLRRAHAIALRDERNLAGEQEPKRAK